jgi:Uma2 family endonuclease
MVAPSAARPIPPTLPASYDDVRNAPDHLIAELLDDELVLSPRPAAPHARASSMLGVALGPLDPVRRERGGGDRRCGWWILDEPELHLGRHVVVPDLAGWREARWSMVPAVRFFTEVPDWICEVISPTSARRDRLQKMNLYAAQGVPHLWLVDPDERFVEVYERREQSWLRVAAHGEDERVSLPPFSELAVDLALLWSAPARPSAPAADPQEPGGP